jgi:hypothetical protein
MEVSTSEGAFGTLVDSTVDIAVELASVSLDFGLHAVLKVPTE